jgi:hypothetical protein
MEVRNEGLSIRFFFTYFVKLTHSTAATELHSLQKRKSLKVTLVKHLDTNSGTLWLLLKQQHTNCATTFDTNLILVFLRKNKIE